MKIERRGLRVELLSNTEEPRSPFSGQVGHPQQGLVLLGCRFSNSRIGLGVSDGYKVDCRPVLLDLEEVFRETGRTWCPYNQVST